MVTKRIEEKILAAFGKIVAQRGWMCTELSDIASESGESLARIAEIGTGKTELLRIWLRTINQTVLTAVEKSDEEETARERLFDVLMVRFEVLSKHRETISRLEKAARCNPLLCGVMMSEMNHSMTWMLQASGISTSGPMGLLRKKGAMFAWYTAYRVWVDDTGELSKTMAMLDKTLHRGENYLNKADNVVSKLICIRKRCKPAPAKTDAAAA